MGKIYIAKSKHELETRGRDWFNSDHSAFTGRVELRLAPWWWRLLRWIGLPTPLLHGMRPDDD